MPDTTTTPTQDERNTSCEARIDSELAATAETIAGFWTREERACATNNEERREENFEEMANYVLGVSVERVYTIQMSTGGPGDQFEVSVDSEGDITRIVYRFLDWYDGATRNVSLSTESGKAIERYCAYILEGFGYDQ